MKTSPSPLVRFPRRAPLLAALFLLPLFLSSCVGSFIYHPEGRFESTPADWGMAFEDVEFSATDGIGLNGWWIPSNNERAVVLFCHGNGGNISYLRDRVLVLHRLGLSVFVFDYRGFGKSKGDPTEEGTYRDARGAWDLLVEKRGIAPDRILVLGRSLGGPVAAHLAAEVRPAGLVLDSTFTSLLAMARERYAWVPEMLLSSYRYHTQEYLKKVKSPVLVLHGRGDEVAPFSHAEALLAAAPEPKRLVEISGTHNEGFNDTPAYATALDEFVNQCVPPAPRADSKADIQALVPSAALDLLARAVTETCPICAKGLRENAVALLAQALVPGRAVRFGPDCPLVPTSALGPLEYSASCREEADTMWPTVVFRVHTQKNHLVGVEEKDYTASGLLPGAAGFVGQARITCFAYGDGPGFSYFPDSHVLMIHLALLPGGIAP